VYVDDVMEGMVMAATHAGIEGQTLDLGSGALVTIREAVETIVTILKPRVQPVFGAVADRPFEITRVADVARTKRLLGWEPATSLEAGLTRTVEWYRTRITKTSKHEGHEGHEESFDLCDLVLCGYSRLFVFVIFVAVTCIDMSTSAQRQFRQRRGDGRHTQPMLLQQVFLRSDMR
jgi:hypothetical protein